MRMSISILGFCVVASACVVGDSNNRRPSGAAPAASAGGSQAAPSGASTLTVQNVAGTTICYLYISSSADNNWGPDRLGSNVLNAGQQYSASLPSGNWDVKAEDCNHNQLYERRNVTVAGAVTLSLSN